jgi:hypothetical protein
MQVAGKLYKGKGGDRKSPSSESRVILDNLGVTWNESSRMQHAAELENKMDLWVIGG